MKPRYILTRHIDTRLSLAESTLRISRATQTRPELANLFVDDESGGPDLVRLGGTDLHGDILIRESEEAGRLALHFRRGDRGAVRAVIESLGGDWVVGRRPRRQEEGISLLDLIQDVERPRRRSRVVFSDRALEDAATCDFGDGELLAMFLLRLGLEDIAECADEPDGPSSALEAVRHYLTDTDRVVIHEGRRVLLDQREVIGGKSEDIDLVVHYALLPGSRRHLIGALSTRPSPL